MVFSRLISAGVNEVASTTFVVPDLRLLRPSACGMDDTADLVHCLGTHSRAEDKSPLFGLSPLSQIFQHLPASDQQYFDASPGLTRALKPKPTALEREYAVSAPDLLAKLQQRLALARQATCNGALAQCIHLTAKAYAALACIIHGAVDMRAAVLSLAAAGGIGGDLAFTLLSSVDSKSMSTCATPSKALLPRFRSRCVLRSHAMEFALPRRTRWRA